MLKTRFVVLLLLAMVGLVACGGGTSSLISTDLSADDVYMGITADDFKAVRTNDAGYRDSSLNRTLDIQSVSAGGMTIVNIAIDDVDPMYGVTLELNYDATKYNPVNVEFNGLIDTPVELAATSVNGLIGLGQVDVNGRAERSGEFATVTFANEPSTVNKAVSAVHDFPMNHPYAPDQLTVPGAVGWEISQVDDAAPAVCKLHATWAIGDGDSNGQTNVSDLTPLVAHGYFNGDFISDTNFAPATADYDANGGVTVSDLTPIGQNFNAYITGIEILVSDTDPPTDVFATLDWADDSEALTLPAAADTTDWDAIFRTWNYEVPNVDMAALDEAGDGDGLVYVASRLTGPDGAGTEVSEPFPAAVFVAGDWVISGFTVQIEGAEGGTGTGGDEFADGNTADVTANEQVTLNVVAIDGTFEGNPIDGTEADYAATLDDIAGRVQWSAATSDIDGFEYTNEVLVLSGTSGNGVTGDVFPDDYNEADAEGRLVANLAALSTYIPSALQYTIDIDVMTDPAVPLVATITSSAGVTGDGNHLVDRNSNTVLEYAFDFGNGGAPGDMSTVGATIYDLAVHDGTGDIVVFEYNDPPALAGEFAIRDDPGGDYILTAILGPGNLGVGKLYALRIMESGYNSVNQPGEFLTPGDLPATVTFNTLPDTNSIDPNIDYLWIFWPEPMMRRNPRAIFNLESGTVVPDDEFAFNDIIKQTGNEFWFESTGKLYPSVDFLEDTDPSSIAEGSGIEGIGWYACPGYIAVNIATLTTPGEPGDPARNFGFRVFGQAGPLGGGTIAVEQQAMAAQAAAGIDWGINIFDDVERGDLELDDRDFSNHVLTGDTAATVAPDVIFIEFDEGYYTDFNQGVPTDMVHTVVRFHNAAETDVVVPWWDPCAALGTNNGFIISHGFGLFDFNNPGTWTGLKVGGTQYEIQLMDPTGTTVQDTFPGQMTVVGTNPNEP